MLEQQIVNGLTLGSIYALLALGYTMVYGVLLMINFAHSEIFMVGAYIGLGLLTLVPMLLSMPAAVAFVIILVLAFAGSGLLAVSVERIAYRPLRSAQRLVPLISAIGVSILLQNAIMLAVGAESQPYPEKFAVHQFSFGGVRVNSHQLLIFGMAVALMVVLHLFVTRTKMGTAMRAVAQNHIVSQLMGINTTTIIVLTFLIGGGLGGIAGVLNGLYYGSIKFNMGFLPGIKAFTAAVLGGIGNIKGAMAGGFVLGLLETLAAGYISSDYKDVIAFVVLIGVLLFRPTGLFGEAVTEKV